jgi:hypothetical protein
VNHEEIYVSTFSDIESEIAMATRNLDKSDSHLLAKLMSLDANEVRVWQPDELGAILRHQLQSLLEFDLTTVDGEVTTQLTTLANSEDLPLRTFGDLLRHPHPPLGLLKLTKDFGKLHRNDPASPLPRDIATVLYFAAIVAALTKLGQRISQLDDQSLRVGVEWVIARPWVDESTRTLFREGLAIIPTQGS